MSAVGVLLGAVCGVLFYCVCAHTTNRNLSALENYNFELVDGVKLKKEKLSAQKSYTEAWGMLDEPRKHLLDNVGGTQRFSRTRLSVILRTCRKRNWPLECAVYRLYSQTMIVYCLFVCLYISCWWWDQDKSIYPLTQLDIFFRQAPSSELYTTGFSVLLCSFLLGDVFVQLVTHTSFQWCL